MTAQLSGQPGEYSSRGSSAARLAVAALGVGAVVLGVVLLTSPVGAAKSLAWLVGAGLVVGGVMEMVDAAADEPRWPGLVLGGLLIAGGVLAVAWPGLTLWTLALTSGLTLIIHGVLRIAVAVIGAPGTDRRGWVAAVGAVNVLVGILVLAWPGATVQVLGLLLGAQVIVFGAVLAAGALLTGNVLSREHPVQSPGPPAA